ncbi:MAG: DUF4124 domain-containing protein [Burkholderiales bacterium]
MTSHSPAALKTNVFAGRIRSLTFVLLTPLLAAVGPATAWADIYKWTDERGGTVISNARPTHPSKVKNFEVAVEEVKSTIVAAPADQMLLDKLDRLERQLLAQQYLQQAQTLPLTSNYAGYNPAPPPPPPGYFGIDYPGYYYPPVISSPYVFYGARPFVSRPRFAVAHNSVVRGGFAHSGGFAYSGGFAHRGRR